MFLSNFFLYPSLKQSFLLLSLSLTQLKYVMWYLQSESTMEPSELRNYGSIFQFNTTRFQVNTSKFSCAA